MYSIYLESGEDILLNVAQFPSERFQVLHRLLALFDDMVSLCRPFAYVLMAFKIELYINYEVESAEKDLRRLDVARAAEAKGLFQILHALLQKTTAADVYAL